MFISSLIFASYYFHTKNGDNFQLVSAAYSPFITLVFGVPTKCKALILIAVVDTMKSYIHTYNYNAKQCGKSQMNR